VRLLLPAAAAADAAAVGLPAKAGWEGGPDDSASPVDAAEPPATPPPLLVGEKLSLCTLGGGLVAGASFSSLPPSGSPT
jgi:hypothetical protein